MKSRRPGRSLAGADAPHAWRLAAFPPDTLGAATYNEEAAPSHSPTACRRPGGRSSSVPPLLHGSVRGDRRPGLLSPTASGPYPAPVEPSKAVTWSSIISAILVVAAGIAWATGLIGWGGFLAVVVLASGSVIATAFEARRRLKDN